MEHCLGVLANEVARLRLIVGEMESIDPATAHVVRELLERVEEMNEELLDHPDILDGQMSWWTEWDRANRPTQ